MSKRLPPEVAPADAPSLKRARPKASNTLDVVNEWLSEEESTALDNQFIQSFDASWSHYKHLLEIPEFRTSGMALILSHVSTLLPSVLDQELVSLATAQERLHALLRTTPAISSVFEEAIEKDSVRPVRLLKVFHVPDPASRRSRRRPVMLYEHRERAVRNAWMRPYQGDFARILLNNINRMNRKEAYSNTAAIVQGSGSGKSRMVQEQASYVFTIPFNLRREVESEDFAYPPPDTFVRRYFFVQQTCFDCARIRFLKFFEVLFEKVYDELELWGPPKDATSFKWWSDHLESGDGNTRRRNMYAAALKECPLPAVHTGSHTTGVDHEPACSALERLLRLIDNISPPGSRSGDGVKLMIYFDEAHDLTAADDQSVAAIPGDPAERDLYDALLSVLAMFTPAPIFALFLSTVSSLSALAPPHHLAKSARIRKNPRSLQAPITETPFDCSPAFPLKPDLRLEDLSTVHYMAQFGRPLFWTMLENASDRPSDIESAIVPLARAKLRGDRSSEAAVYATALADIVLNVSFDPRRDEAKQRQINMVASHMRTVFSVPQHRGYFRSGYPSEPILAEAAMQEIYTSNLQGIGRRNFLLSTLNDDLKNEILDKGQCGEVVARTLLVLAYMKQIPLEQGAPSNLEAESSPSNLVFSKGCSFIGWLEQLLQPEAATLILDSVPDNVAEGIQFRTAFANATVRITHWLRMSDDTGPNRASFYAAFLRGAGLIFWHSEAQVDLGVPLLLDPDGPVREDNIGIFLLQIKNRAKAGTKRKYEIEESSLGGFPPESSEAPHVTWIVELGVQPALNKVQEVIRPRRFVSKSGQTGPGKDVPPAKGSSPASTTPAVLGTPSRVVISRPPERFLHHPPKRIHPRYSAFIYGCSDTIYKVIDSSERVLYSRILANRDMLLEHPRQDERTLGIVRRMKPVWTEGPDCYDWLYRNEVKE